jgi:hypothetical protein
MFLDTDFESSENARAVQHLKTLQRDLVTRYATGDPSALTGYAVLTEYLTAYAHRDSRDRPITAFHIPDLKIPVTWDHLFSWGSLGK